MKVLRNQRVFLILAAALAASSCTSGKSPERGEGSEAAPKTRVSSTLTIKGSDTMVILAQNWAQAFMDANPGKVLQVSGGGSGTGLAALINGTADLANASRPIKDKERKQLMKRRGAEAHAFRVALDSLAVSHHPLQPGKQLGHVHLLQGARARQ